jgi:hypothetical protein
VKLRLCVSRPDSGGDVGVELLGDFLVRKGFKGAEEAMAGMGEQPVYAAPGIRGRNRIADVANSVFGFFRRHSREKGTRSGCLPMVR